MVKIDELQETIAQIRMVVDNDQQARMDTAKDNQDDDEILAETAVELVHWALGAPFYCRVTAEHFELEFTPREHAYERLDMHLKSFISSYYPEEQILPDSDIYASLTSQCQFTLLTSP